MNFIASEILDGPNVAIPGFSFERQVLSVWRGERIRQPLATATMPEARDGAGGRDVNQIVRILHPGSRKEAFSVRGPSGSLEPLPSRVNRDLTRGPVVQRKYPDASLVRPVCDAGTVW